MNDSLFRHKEMDTWERWLSDKSPLTGRIWNIDAAGHGGGEGGAGSSAAYMYMQQHVCYFN